jgi:hypothetical protein
LLNRTAGAPAAISCIVIHWQADLAPKFLTDTAPPGPGAHISMKLGQIAAKYMYSTMDVGQLDPSDETPWRVNDLVRLESVGNPPGLKPAGPPFVIVRGKCRLSLSWRNIKKATLKSTQA